jgi:PRTRC genetic system ThiF family protein
MDNLKSHIAPKYFLNPNHEISIVLIGCGGNGSLLLSRLARIDYALKKSNKLGLKVTVFDDDVVEEFNVGRQMFGVGDIGENKAISLCSKINRNFFATFKAVPKKFDFNTKANIYITAVDNADFRIQFDAFFKSAYSYNKKYENTDDVFYWMDLGNSKNIGQCIIGSAPINQRNNINTISQLKTIIDKYPNLKEMDVEEIQGLGCSSFADKLNEQNLFINDALTAMSSHLLWELFTNGFINSQGFFINLSTLKSNPISLSNE